MNYQAPLIEWKTSKFGVSYANTVTHSYRIDWDSSEKRYVCSYYNTRTNESDKKWLDSKEALKAWVETIHYPSALQKAGFKPVDQKALKPTVYRLDYFDGEYRWDLVHSYDRAELEKLIADATEYHKTIKDLDFDDDEAVDAWLENHPLDDFNGDQINDLLDIDDYEPLSEYLSINSFEVSGVSQ